MFEVKVARAAALVLLATGAAVLISCQAEVTAPAPPESEAPSFDVVRIWGYVEDDFGIRLKDADVEWWCNTCTGEPIGSDAVDDIGRYDIDPPPPFNWGDHDDHDLEGEAYKTGYYGDPQYIDDFDSSAVYQRDFELYEE
jgi:hypothetical protein